MRMLSEFPYRFLLMARKSQRAANAKRDRKVPVEEPQRWVLPAFDPSDERVEVIEPDSTNRIIQRRVVVDGQLLDYAVTHVTLIGPDEWEQVGSIDCCHGDVHKHSGAGHKRGPTIRPIYTQADVQSSFNSSFDEIYDDYETFRGQQ
jgi:hypothetical protein